MVKLSKPSKYLKKNEVAIEQYRDIGFYKNYFYLVKYWGDEYHLKQLNFSSKEAAIKFANELKITVDRIKKITWSPSKE